MNLLRSLLLSATAGLFVVVAAKLNVEKSNTNAPVPPVNLLNIDEEVDQDEIHPLYI